MTRPLRPCGFRLSRTVAAAPPKHVLEYFWVLSSNIYCQRSRFLFFRLHAHLHKILFFHAFFITFIHLSSILQSLPPSLHPSIPIPPSIHSDLWTHGFRRKTSKVRALFTAIELHSGKCVTLSQCPTEMILWRCNQLTWDFSSGVSLAMGVPQLDGL